MKQVGCVKAPNAEGPGFNVPTVEVFAKAPIVPTT